MKLTACQLDKISEKVKFIIKQANWIKMAMAYPIPSAKSQELAEKGYYSVPDIEKKFPKGGLTEHKKILEETGAGQLFGPAGVKLRKWYLPKQKNIVFIDGKEYFLLHVEKSGTEGRGKNKVAVPGRIVVQGPIVRGSNGKIDFQNTGYQRKEFDYDVYKDQIQRSPAVVKENLDEINGFVDKYNEFVDKQIKKTKGSSLTILPLQIKWAEDLIKDRLQTLIEQKKSFTTGKKSAGVSEVYDYMLEGVRSKQITDISPQDYALLLLERKFHSVPSLQELKNEIVNEKMPFDDNTNDILKKYLNAVIDWQIKVRQDEEAKKTQQVEEREERIEGDLPEMKKLFLDNVKKIENLPGTYDKASGFYSPHGFGASEHEATQTIDRDHSELTAILGSLERARHSIIELPEATNVFLQGEGSMKLEQINEFMKNAELFLKRYKESPFIETEQGLEINPKLFGRQGTMGNALIAVVLRQIILSTTKEIERIKAGKQPEISMEGKVEPKKDMPVDKVDRVEKDEKIPEKTANKVDVKKLSGYLWQVFENRMKPKF